MKQVYLLDGKGKIKNLPTRKAYYEPCRVPRGLDLVKIFFSARELKQKKISYDELMRLGFLIVDGKLKASHVPMYTNQEYYHKLVHKKEVLKKDWLICSECPSKVKIRLDLQKGRVRIEGRGTNYENKGYKGSWKNFSDYEGDNNED